MSEEESDRTCMSRRQFLQTASAVALSVGLNPFSTIARAAESASVPKMKTRSIPGTSEQLPVVGLGTWQQFDVSPDPQLLKPLKNVLGTLFQQGGTVIDTSPMYGNAESNLGRLLKGMGARDRAFLATKVWTRGKQSGIDQMNRSMEKLNVDTIDLIQVHNLLDWQTHLETLRDWKSRGKIRYYGITHYTGSAFDELESIMSNEPLDFVQLPYSIEFRRAEDRLLPLARERGIAVLVNRPFQAGGLFRDVRGQNLPEWAGEFDCNSWAQFFLKYILSHPAVTCGIPGTSNPDHMLDNAKAGMGALPNKNQRKRMIQFWKSKP
ncbi:MAG: aldo/keto reductase [bacterium]